jgi:hypothetical protein
MLILEQLFYLSLIATIQIKSLLLYKYIRGLQEVGKPQYYTTRIFSLYRLEIISSQILEHIALVRIKTRLPIITPF